MNKKDNKLAPNNKIDGKHKKAEIPVETHGTPTILRIVGRVKTADGLFYQVRWSNCDHVELVMPSTVRKLCPGLAANFYNERSGPS